ncbi:MAG: PDZ domain-containing protein [Verrucomicrobiota bacterium]
MNRIGVAHKIGWISGCWLILIAAPLLSQQKQSQEKIPSLRNLQFINRVHVETLKSSLNDLSQKYRQALTQLQEKSQQSGNLNQAIALRDELTRHAANQAPVSTFSEIPSLAKLQKIYLLSYAKEEATLKKQLAKAKLDYQKKLQVMMRKLMAEGKQEEADKVLAAFAEIDHPSGGGPLPFKERLNSDQYQTHLTRARLDLEKIKNSERSPYAYVVKSVAPDSVAENLGIQPGDRIIKVDGQELWCDHLDWHHEKKLRELVWEDAEGKQQAAEIGSGKIGILYEGDLIFHQYYLMFGKRNPRWDKFILTALLAAETDPDLAETAMQQAVAEGYQADGFSSAIGVLIALRENRLNDALKFARHILKQAGNDAGEIPRAIFTVFYRAALAAGQLDLLEQADREAGNQLSRLDEERWPEFISHWRTVRTDWKTSGRPSRKIPDKLKDDVFKKRKLITDFMSGKKVDIPRRQVGPDIISITPNHFITSFHAIDGGLQNFVWETVFEAKPNDATSEHHRFQPMLEFSALNYLKGGKQPLASAQFFKTRGSQHRLMLRGGQTAWFRPYFHSKWDAGDKSGTTRLRIIRIDNEVEIQVNGGTQLWLPLDQQVQIHDVGFYIKIVGMTVNFKESHIWRLP